jgi:hypothetical protein
MIRSKTKFRVFTVVDVWRGIAVGAKNFRRFQDAQNYMQRLKGRRNLDADDVQLFETRIDMSSPEPHSARAGV